MVVVVVYPQIDSLTKDEPLKPMLDPRIIPCIGLSPGVTMMIPHCIIILIELPCLPTGSHRVDSMRVPPTSNPVHALEASKETSQCGFLRTRSDDPRIYTGRSSHHHLQSTTKRRQFLSATATKVFN
ncbi:Hypothetical protein FKW44_019350 [Caligus rogercresseyi]|uniref:Uncharacterized protein n=1 Tax=Caligus rogercresseyi TaxID=217165 RepID=A0A7T8JYQ0_CALRO|nr:Hypothetical protein FKW44_019350 [Caligus rogercresseyi]